MCQLTFLNSAIHMPALLDLTLNQAMWPVAQPCYVIWETNLGSFVQNLTLRKNSAGVSFYFYFSHGKAVLKSDLPRLNRSEAWGPLTKPWTRPDHVTKHWRKQIMEMEIKMFCSLWPQNKTKLFFLLQVPNNKSWKPETDTDHFLKMQQ